MRHHCHGEIPPRLMTLATVVLLTGVALAGLHAPHASAFVPIPESEPREPCESDVSVHYFYASRTTLEAGESTTLYWNVGVPSHCASTSVKLVVYSTGAIVSTAPSGSTTVSPAFTTTYRLKASYAGRAWWLDYGAPRSVTVQMPVPFCTDRCTGQASCSAVCAGDAGETTTCGNWGYCRSNCAANDRNTVPNSDMGGTAGAPVQVQASLTSGINGGAPAGRYNVTLAYHSPKRFAHTVNDGGHQDLFCARRDAHRWACYAGDESMDGVRLEPDAHGWAGGQQYTGWTEGVGINGPQMKDVPDQKREWHKDADNDHCRAWTLIADHLFTVRYSNVVWNGTPLTATIWVTWKEDDPTGWDDHSARVYFDTGNALTACLQHPTGGWLIPQPSPYWFSICSESGGCEEPEHFKIRTYYRVKCSRVAWHPDTSSPGGGSTPDDPTDDCPASLPSCQPQ
jgi:hypothetical protein